MHRPFVTLALLSLSTMAAAAPLSYTIDPAHTYPHFAISHLGFSTLHGRFNHTRGKLIIDEAAHSGSVEVVIDAASIDTAHKKRDDHLRSPDFLNAVEFPEITYRSSHVTLHDGSATVAGELTIMGVSRPVTLDVQHIKCGVNPISKKAACGFDASATIKRSDFGITYGLPGIGDEMQLTFEVEAIRD